MAWRFWNVPFFWLQERGWFFRDLFVALVFAWFFSVVTVTYCIFCYCFSRTRLYGCCAIRFAIYCCICRGQWSGIWWIIMTSVVIWSNVSTHGLSCLAGKQALLGEKQHHHGILQRPRHHACKPHANCGNFCGHKWREHGVRSPASFSVLCTMPVLVVCIYWALFSFSLRFSTLPVSTRLFYVLSCDRYLLSIIPKVKTSLEGLRVRLAGDA